MVELILKQCFEEFVTATLFPSLWVWAAGTAGRPVPRGPVRRQKMIMMMMTVIINNSHSNYEAYRDHANTVAISTMTANTGKLYSTMIN